MWVAKRGIKPNEVMVHEAIYQNAQTIFMADTIGKKPDRILPKRIKYFKYKTAKTHSNSL